MGEGERATQASPKQRQQGQPAGGSQAASQEQAAQGHQAGRRQPGSQLEATRKAASRKQKAESWRPYVRKTNQS